MNTPSSALTRYYQFHAGIYDATRWSFLFGREDILKQVRRRAAPLNILEIGCGTGHNLNLLAKFFPRASIIGIDLSGAMLAKAKMKLSSHGERVQLREAAYDAPIRGESEGFDLILASYALSMFNPGWEQALQAAEADLSPNGRIAVVDFHQPRLPGFGKWMGMNHVRMDGHLLAGLQSKFKPEVCLERPAYGGVWDYLQFIGHKKTAPGV
jgi:S-adenosylmethionine-diacylgycerolhomoserine-N-methlytransferase